MVQAILILGAAMRSDGTPGPALLRRAHHTAAPWRKTPQALIIATGAGGEAAAIATLCRASGVPGDQILEEPCATNTAQNIAYARPLLHARGIQMVTLVTDRYHLPRARLLARRAGLVAIPGAVPISGAAPHRQARMILREAVAYLVTLITDPARLR